MQSKLKYLPGLALIFIFILTACHHFDNADVKPLYNTYKFDTNVINKLPLYDSLRMSIIANFPFFKKYIRDDDNYRSFKYIPSSEDEEVFKLLPKDITPQIDQWFNRLGKDFIYGFDIFKDSTIKVLVRKSKSDTADVKIFEHMSYFPQGGVKKRTFPAKDTMLTTNWQYWVAFYGLDGFDD